MTLLRNILFYAQTGIVLFGRMIIRRARQPHLPILKKRRHRNIWNFAANILAALCAYILHPKKNHQLLCICLK